ncbi:MAG: hypothetical protein WCK89_13425 [bacterium]
MKPGTSSVFVGGGAARASISWRLDVREDSHGNKHFFSKRKRPSLERARPKLFHYISAGGMRQLRRTSVDDLIEDRRRSFLIFLVFVVAGWLVFYFFPSA